MDPEEEEACSDKVQRLPRLLTSRAAGTPPRTLFQALGNLTCGAAIP